MINESFLISTSSHIELAKNLSSLSNISLLDLKLTHFANKEVRTTISKSIRGKNIYIVSSPNSNKQFSINDYVIETYLLICTCRRSDAASITLLCPCFPYARQDKKENSRVCISAKDIADLFVNGGINRIVCFDLHSHQIQGFFNIPCDNFYCINMIHQYLIENYNIHNDNNEEELNEKYVIIAPDEGALKRVQQYANKFHMPFMVISKERDYSKANHVERAVLIGDKKYLENRTAIIIDDMADTCGTVIKVCDVLMSKGAKEIIVIVTHGILSDPAIERINSSDCIKEFIVSDSLPQKKHKEMCPKLKTFSIVPLLSEAINRLNAGRSLSEIFY